jgi:hypothetical protein
MDSDSLVAEYLDAVRTADAPRMLALFATDAVVHSPLYGDLPAADFYPRLFADTQSADLTLLGTSTGKTVDGRSLIMFLFRFDWVLRAGTDIIAFDVVDVLELDASGRVTALTIVYDTKNARPAFESAKQAGHQ